MANVEQFQNEAPLVTQRTGLLATSSNALARVREALDQPGLEEPSSDAVSYVNGCCCDSIIFRYAKTGNDHPIQFFVGKRKVKSTKCAKKYGCRSSIRPSYW